MAGEFDATIDATVAGGESATEGKYPWEWSVEEIAIAAAQAGATAYCTAVGAGPAAPLCGILAAEVMGWAMDNIVGPIGGAFADLFGPGTEAPRLIQRDACNRGPYLNEMMDDYYTAFLLNAIGAHSRLELPGTYFYREAMWSMGVRGLQLPRRHNYLSTFGGTTNPEGLLQNVPFPPDFSAEYAVYLDVRLRELEGATKAIGSWDPIRSEPKTVHLQLSRDEKCAMALNEFEDGRIQTWIDHFQRLLAEEIANLIEVAVALKIQSEARALALENPQLVADRAIAGNIAGLSRTSWDDVSITAFDSQLRLVQPAAPDPVRQWIEADPRNAPPYAWKGAA